MENNHIPIQLQSSKSTPIMSQKRPYRNIPPMPSHPQRNPQRNRPVTHFAINSSQKGSMSVPQINVLKESRLNQTFKYHSNQGRLKSHCVGFATYGADHAHPVFVIGGYGCTRLVGIMFEELAYRYGIRMIWPERPGYGLSEDCNSQDMTALGWADVIIQLANHLKIERFSLIAQSVGTVFALAVAHKYPTRVLGPIFLISPWVSTQVANIFKWTRRIPATVVAKTISLALDVMWIFNKNESTQNNRNTMMAFEEDQLLAALDEEATLNLKTDFPTDRPLRHFVRPRYMSLYLEMNRKRTTENYSQGQLCDVMVALEKYHMFDFSYSDIKIPISAVWGDKDSLIPPKAIDTLANTLHDIRIKILESEGHDLVWKEGVMEWAIRGISERWKKL